MPRPTRGPSGALRLRGCHPLRRSFPAPSASPWAATGLVRFRSPLLPESPLMSVPPGTEMFQFPGFASPAYGFGRGSPRREGFPHSDTRGSTIARISPRLFAACHVLHRLLAPRHPPNALLSLYLSPAAARAPNQGAPVRQRACHRGTRSVTHTHSLDNLLSQARRLPDSPCGILAEMSLGRTRRSATGVIGKCKMFCHKNMSTKAARGYG